MTNSTVKDTWFEDAKNGDLNTLKQFLETGVDINRKDECDNTALHLATKAAQLETMQWLINNGADLHAANNWLSTPLHLCEKNIATIRILLEASANPNLKDKDFDYPYYFAFYGSMTKELMDLYIKYGAELIYKKDM